MPKLVKPSLSSKSNIIFIFWIAWPAEPFIKLSIEVEIIILPSILSSKIEIKQLFEPLTLEVSDGIPSFEIWT